MEVSWPKAMSLLWSLAVFFVVVDAVPPEIAEAQRRSRLRLLLIVYIAFGVLMTCMGLLASKSDISWLPIRVPVSGLQLASGQSINPNEVGGVITLFLPLVVAMWTGTWTFPEQRSPVRLTIWLLLVIFFGVALLFTRSIGAWAGAVVGCGLILMLVNRRTRLMLATIGMLALVSVIVVRLSPFLNRFIGTTRVTLIGSIDTRIRIWDQVLLSIKDFLLVGTGLGTFRYVAPSLYPLADGTQDLGHAHNLFLQAVLDFGLLGGLLFALVWVVLAAYLVRSLRYHWRTKDDLVIRIMIIGLLGTLLAHAIFSLADALAPGARPGFALWYLFGLSVVAGTITTSSCEMASRWRMASAAVLLVSSVVLVWFFLPMQRVSNATAVALQRGPRNIDDTITLVAQTAKDNCRAYWHLGLLENEHNDIRSTRFGMAEAFRLFFTVHGFNEEPFSRIGAIGLGCGREAA